MITERLNTIDTHLQTQNRIRVCSLAEHGGSTAVCTENKVERRSCNTNPCRESISLHCLLLLLSCSCFLGSLATLDTVQFDLWRRGRLYLPLFVTPLRCRVGPRSAMLHYMEEMKVCAHKTSRRSRIATQHIAVSLIPLSYLLLTFTFLAIDSSWAFWGSWGACSETCGPAVSPNSKE